LKLLQTSAQKTSRSSTKQSGTVARILTPVNKYTAWKRTKK